MHTLLYSSAHDATSFFPFVVSADVFLLDAFHNTLLGCKINKMAAQLQVSVQFNQALGYTCDIIIPSVLHPRSIRLKEG